jgi:hypothetical protein
MKKYILTESQYNKLMNTLMLQEEVTSSGKGKLYGCNRNQTLEICYKKSGLKGSPKFGMKDPIGLASMLYQVAPGDTWNGIMNNVLGIDKFYPISSPNPSEKKEAMRNYEYWSKNVLDMNPQLGGNKAGIKAGDILHLEAPYD